jgi:hypothetical protein
VVINATKSIVAVIRGAEYSLPQQIAGLVLDSIGLLACLGVLIYGMKMRLMTQDLSVYFVLLGILMFGGVVRLTFWGLTFSSKNSSYVLSVPIAVVGELLYVLSFLALFWAVSWLCSVWFRVVVQLRMEDPLKSARWIRVINVSMWVVVGITTLYSLLAAVLTWFVSLPNSSFILIPALQLVESLAMIVLFALTYMQLRKTESAPPNSLVFKMVVILSSIILVSAFILTISLFVEFNLFEGAELRKLNPSFVLTIPGAVFTCLLLFVILSAFQSRVKTNVETTLSEDIASSVPLLQSEISEIPAGYDYVSFLLFLCVFLSHFFFFFY